MVRRLGALTLAATAAHAADSSDCWKTNGTSSDVYLNYRFFDYRNISNIPTVPDLIPADADLQGTNANSQGGYVNQTDTFGKWWVTEQFTYLKAKDNNYPAQASMANVYIQPKDSYNGPHSKDSPGDDIMSWLTLRTSRPDKKFATMSQITSTDVYVYGTMRFAGRVVGPGGSCAGFFSYALNDGDNNEADIEILTKDDAYANGLEVHYTNQPSDINGMDSGTSLNSTLSSPFYNWQTHRFDWREPATDFYGDGGQHKLTIDRQVPKGESQLTVNMWSTGNDWTDQLAVGDDAQFQILWIEWAYNTTADSPDAKCTKVWDMDDESVDALSPSLYAQEQLKNGATLPLAIPSDVYKGQTNATDTTSPSESGHGNGSSKVAMGSSILVSVVAVAAMMFL